jgi:hypothetical protein
VILFQEELHHSETPAELALIYCKQPIFYCPSNISEFTNSRKSQAHTQKDKGLLTRQ